MHIMENSGIIELFEEMGVPIASRKHEHYRYGWIQVCCPFCGDGNFQLGQCQQGYFNCYRWKPD